jgi:hypothetical protein
MIARWQKLKRGLMPVHPRIKALITGELRLAESPGRIFHFYPLLLLKVTG